MLNLDWFWEKGRRVGNDVAILFSCHFMIGWENNFLKIHLWTQSYIMTAARASPSLLSSFICMRMIYYLKSYYSWHIRNCKQLNNIIYSYFYRRLFYICVIYFWIFSRISQDLTSSVVRRDMVYLLSDIFDPVHLFHKFLSKIIKTDADLLLLYINFLSTKNMRCYNLFVCSCIIIIMCFLITWSQKTPEPAVPSIF